MTALDFSSTRPSRNSLHGGVIGWLSQEISNGYQEGRGDAQQDS